LKKSFANSNRLDLDILIYNIDDGILGTLKIGFLTFESVGHEPLAPMDEGIEKAVVSVDGKLTF